MSIDMRVHVDTFITLLGCSPKPTRVAMKTCQVVWVVLPLFLVIRDISVAKNQTENRTWQRSD